jgi:hypothetical protein
MYELRRVYRFVAPFPEKISRDGDGESMPKIRVNYLDTRQLAVKGIIEESTVALIDNKIVFLDLGRGGKGEFEREMSQAIHPLAI